MATTTLSFQKRARYINTWDSEYVTASGTDYLGQYYYAISYKFSPYKASNVTISEITLNLALAGVTGQQCPYDLYLYSTDPAGTTSAPSGALKHINDTKPEDYSGIQWKIPWKENWASYDTLYILIVVNYYNGQVYLNHDGSSIAETYTESPPISFGTVTADNTGMHIPINYGNNVALTCRITAGNTDYPGNNEELYSVTSSSGRFDVPVDAVDWFDNAAITNSFTIPITITVTGGNPSPITKGLRYVEDRAAAKESMRPTVSSITKLIQQPDGFPNDYASTYIAGFSKCKLTAVITRPTDAPVSTVTLSYPGGRTVTMTPVSGSTDTYEGTTFSALAQDTTFTVTVTDARGLSNTGTESVAGVVPYVLPSVSIDPANTYRCNSQGVKTDGGDHYKIRVIPQIYTNLTGNTITELTVGLKSVPDGTPGRYPIPNNSTTSETLPPVSAAAANTLSQPKQAYVLTVIIQDRISGQVVREYTLKGMQRDLVLNHDGGYTHLGVGTTPVGKNITGYTDTIELPNDGQFLMGGIPAQAFNVPYWAGKTSADPCFGDDFLTIAEDRTGEANATAIFGFPASDYNLWTNIPEDPLDQQSPAAGIRTLGWIGWREVFYFNKNIVLVKITEVVPVAGRIWFCAKAKNTSTQEYTWTNWKYIMPTTVV